MMTKPCFDSATYPWVAANLRNNLRSDELVVLLDNFADKALPVWPATNRGRRDIRKTSLED
jgi:hypothetical protein